MTTGSEEQRLAKVRAELRRDVAERQAGYRMRALKLFPHVCGRCGREFEGKRIKELTVHHKDFNHDNNPPDGSNWELLCIYCHDNEHQKQIEADRGNSDGRSARAGGATHSPFAGLQSLLKPDQRS